MLICLVLWFGIGGLMWYRFYPDPSKFPHLLFLLLWPFLFGAAVLELIFESKEESRGKENEN